MNPGKIDGATRALGAPAGWDKDQQMGVECEVLQVRDIMFGDRIGYMQSAWYPTHQEKQAIAQGKPITLTVWGGSHPPVSVNIEE
jgi:hypothetical protein